MFKKWKKGHHLDPQREKIKDELFAFKKTAHHGFPHQPSALAFDPRMKLMAVGNKHGCIKVFGAPGVEFTGWHDGENQIVQLHFLTGEARLVSILDDGTIHLWELQAGKEDKQSQELVKVGKYQLSGRPGINQITEVMIKSTNDAMWVGTESGGIYPLTLPSFEPCNGGLIHQDQVMQSIPESYKTGKALGPVEAIEEHPTDPNLVLIGYSRGLVVLWNDQTKNVEKYFLGNQQLEAVSWNSNGREFMTAHNDGSLLTWQLTDNDVIPTPNIPYGPFPCKAITKIMWKTSKTQPFVVFSGGMPRANYGDRHCVSVICGRDHVTFDITSRIIDFFLVCENNSSFEDDENPEYLIVLAEEELIAIDLTKEGWPSMMPPYLSSLHSSAITCSTHVSGMSNQVWQKIETAAQAANLLDGRNKKKQHISLDSFWPIDGGVNLAQSSSEVGARELLLTGHEDGTIKLWDTTTSCLKPVMKLYTSYLFVTDGDTVDNDAFEDEYPPFRKIGEFDPYSDDPKLGIKKLAMCQQTGTIVAGGTAGQVFVFVLSDDAIETGLTTKEVDILNERAGFTWKGHDKLIAKDIHLSLEPGYQVNSVVQCKPPASITALNVQAQWGLVGFGTSHGYALFDYQQNKCVLSQCTLEAGDHSAMDGHFTRAKSFKMSLRQSIRRLRGSFKKKDGSKQRVSGRRRNYRRGDMSKKLQEANAALVDEEETPGGAGAWSPAGQRKVEARSTDEGMSGMIRCVYFANTYVRDTVSLSPTFWIGTNTGSIYVYGLDVPDYSKRQELEVTSILGKEIQLMHRAPVINVTVMDSQGSPVHLSSNKTSNGTTQNSTAHHFVVISSEEQFKIFSLPKISPRKKLKLTAFDGSLVRKVVHSRFNSVTNPDYSEHALVCLTNQGEILVINVLPSFRPQVHYPCIGSDNPLGIGSAILTTSGQGFYLLSTSEFERFSLSASNVVEPNCLVRLDPSTPIAPLPKKVTTQAQIEHDGNHTDANTDISPAKSPEKQTPKKVKREGSVVVAMTTPSPKQPLLGESEDDDDVDDSKHFARHERR